MLFQISFHVRNTPDGLYHVQNYINGLAGQHHVHTKAGYDDWINAKPDIITPSLVTERDPGPCSCGLSAGDCREYDGKTWHNPEWAT